MPRRSTKDQTTARPAALVNKRPSKRKPRAAAHPFLKWAGGKSQLLSTFQNYYPPELAQGQIQQYVEPFLGSGAVFFDVVQKFKIHSAILGDINQELILAWRVIQQDVEELIEALKHYAGKYKRLDRPEQKGLFYEVRKTYNMQRSGINYKRYSKTKWIPRAAQLIFLNRTCYNGLFRMNSKGEFNTPVGDYKNPRIADSENLRKVAKLLGIADIRALHFSEIEPLTQENSFVYFDPPYRPLSRTASFTEYSSNTFGDEQQVELAKLFAALNEKQSKLMLSNSDPKNENPEDEFFDALYADFNVFRVRASRMINSDKNKRGQINEIVVTNYPASRRTAVP